MLRPGPYRALLPSLRLSLRLGLLLPLAPLWACTDRGNDSGASSGTTATSSSASSEPTGGDTGTTSATDGTVTGATTGTGAPTSAATSSETGEDLPDGACRVDADCNGRIGDICLAPGELSCGPCQVPIEPCADDSSCQPGFVCAPFTVPCACSTDQRQCIPACTDDCQEGFQCDVDTGLCEPLLCSQGRVECPPTSDCLPGSGGNECQHRPCFNDDPCQGTLCVQGFCHEQLGTCEQPGV